jgi:hypothetical protein
MREATVTHHLPTSPVPALVSVLGDIRRLVERLDDVAYASPAPGRSSGGVGGHVRHTIDHVTALLDALDTGVCAYDRRRRGTDVERCRTVALVAIEAAVRGVRGLTDDRLDEAVLVEAQLDEAGATTILRSTVGREVAFVSHHAVHHNAFVKELLRARGVEIDARFGLAPATPTDASPVVCAR